MMMTMLVLAVGVTARAADLDLPHGKWWENERVVQRIGLTSAQRTAIGELVYQHALRMIDLNAEVKKAELELGDLVDRDEVDPTAVRRAFGSFQAARNKLENERFEMLLAVRGTLTVEQWRSLLEIRRLLERMRENRRPGDGPPGMPRSPDGERRPPADEGFG
jgi:Spy/CpxP family protein refolding chaperone